MYNVTVLSSAITFFFFVLLALEGALHLRRVLGEILNLGLLLLLFHQAPLLLSFGLFFGFWHSLPVMLTEYSVLKQKAGPSFNAFKLIHAMLPVTVISLIGLTLLILAGHLFNELISPVILLVIGISSLTLPHAVTMEAMYRRAAKFVIKS